MAITKVTPSLTLQLECGSLTASYLNGIGRCLIHLAKQPFVPSPNLDLATLVECDYAGYFAIAADTVTNIFRIQPSGQWVVEFQPPVDGFMFGFGGPAGLPQTAYGFWVTDAANTILIASELFPEPCVMADGFDGVEVVAARLGLIAPM